MLLTVSSVYLVFIPGAIHIVDSFEAMLEARANNKPMKEWLLVHIIFCTVVVASICTLTKEKLCSTNLAILATNTHYHHHYYYYYKNIIKL